MSGLQLYNGNWPIAVLDFDGNILDTKTKVYFKNKLTGEIENFYAYEVDQNPNKFSGENSIYEEISATFSESMDFFPFREDHRGFDTLPKDISLAIENGDFAKSFDIFKEIFLVGARFFTILTARGNSPDVFLKGIYTLNQETLSREQKEEQYENILKNYNLSSKISKEEALLFYLSQVGNYISCNNFQVEKIMGFHGMRSSERKANSIDYILKYYTKFLKNLYGKKIKEILGGNSISIGFSDDSISNLVAVSEKLSSLHNYKKIPLKTSSYFTGPEDLRENVLNILKGKDLNISYKDDYKKPYLKLKIKK